MTDAGFKFRTLKALREECFPQNLKRHEISDFLCRQKAEELFPQIIDDEVLVTADTIVWFNEQVLNKPKDFEDAFLMLNTLSGNTHSVYTSVCIRSNQKEIIFNVHTEVTFKSLTDDEINYYINNYKPFDKAGAYGAQDWLGITSVSEIKGSFFNVMGLPVKELLDHLKEFLPNSLSR